MLKYSWLGLLALSCTAVAQQPWAYVVGEARPEQQGNFCSTRADAGEIASIFRRFGPRTGFSALSSAPGCALEVHTVTPRELVHRVTIPTASQGDYDVNFIRVQVADGSERYLVTTRRLIDKE